MSQRQQLERIFEIDRQIRSVEEHFEREANFSADDWIAYSFRGIHGETSVEVEIWFDSYQARWIREQSWPEGYKLKELDQGKLVLRFETGGLEGVKMWVMQYGSHAEVLTPPELREAVAEELRRAMGRYEHVSLDD